jgi:hypothetical protein
VVDEWADWFLSMFRRVTPSEYAAACASATVSRDLACLRSIAMWQLYSAPHGINRLAFGFTLRRNYARSCLSCHRQPVRIVRFANTAGRFGQLPILRGRHWPIDNLRKLNSPSLGLPMKLLVGSVFFLNFAPIFPAYPPSRGFLQLGGHSGAA